MDLDNALAEHVQWKLKLHDAAKRAECLDVAAISTDNACPLGQWLHGEAHDKYGSLSSYWECVTAHAMFHKQAGKLAAQVNQGKFSEQTMSDDSPFGEASVLIATAITRLQKDAKLYGSF
jgi:hypothetical protein